MAELSLSLNLNYGQHAVRVAGTRERPEWVAADVGDILGIKNVRQLVVKFRASERGVCTLYTPGGPQEMLTVTEPGLYQLIFKSRKPEAERFRDWVTHDVLPAIREHGCYPPPEVGSDDRAIVVRNADMREFANAISTGIGQHLRQTNDRIETLEVAVNSGFDEMGKRIDRLEKRRPLNEATKQRHLAVVFHKYGGDCPCCRKVQILNENGGKLTNLHFEHFRGKSRNDDCDTWAVCDLCNRALENGDKRDELRPHFDSYQLHRKQFLAEKWRPLIGMEDVIE